MSLSVFLCVLCGENASAQSLTPEASVLEAVRQNPKAKAARFARDAAQVEADREKPVARPTVEAKASGTLQGPRVTFPGVNGPATVLPEGVGRLDLILEQPLYRAGQKAAQQRYAAQSAIVELDYRKALAEVALTARKAYYDVLKAESGLRTAQDGLDAAKRYQTLVQHQIDGGFAKPVDAHTVEGQVAEAQSGVIQAEGAVALARQAFNRALGRPLNTPVTLEPVETLPNVPDSPDSAVANALHNRPELVSLELSRIAAKAGIALAKAQGQPGLNLRGQVTEQTPTAFAHEHYAAIGLELRWPLLDAGKTRLDTREAEAEAQRLDALLADAQQGITLDVSQAWQKMREARSRIEQARIQRSGAEATEAVAEKAYEVGRSTVVEVQSAQREVRLARECELQAIYDLHQAAVDFTAAQGLALPEAAMKQAGKDR